jgi:fatty acid synthase, animal type
MLQVWDCNKKAPEAVGTGFNLVVASNAIHTCDDMATTLKHAYDILADGGFLMCYEAIVGPHHC